MGTTGSKAKPTQTEIKLILDRECQQSGAAVRGRISLVLGDAQRQLFSQFDHGAVIAVKLTGTEKVYWATGYMHDAKAAKQTKHLVSGDARREHSRNLIHEEIQLRQFSLPELEQAQGKFEVPFKIPLPDNLPPTMLYCGEMMSYLSVQYQLTAQLIGLRRQTGGSIPSGQLIIQQTQFLNMRELDPQLAQPVEHIVEGDVKGAFGLLGKGRTKVEGMLVTPRTCQQSEAIIKLAIDNSQCQKMVANVKFVIKRTITAYAMTTRNERKEFKDEQVVMQGRFEDQVASKEPRKIARDYAILIKKMQASDKEQNRFLMLTDFETGYPMPVPLKKMQHEVLPSVNTPNLQIEYSIDVDVSHEGTFGSSQDIPTVKLPLYVTVDPQGPFDLSREGLLLSQEKLQMDLAIQASQVNTATAQQPHTSAEDREIQEAIRASQASHAEYVKQRSGISSQYPELPGREEEPQVHPAKGGQNNFFKNYDSDNNLVPGLPMDEPMIHAPGEAGANPIMYGEPVFLPQQQVNQGDERAQAATMMAVEQDFEVMNPQDYPQPQQPQHTSAESDPQSQPPPVMAPDNMSAQAAAQQYPQF